MNVHKNARLTPRGREISVSRLKRGERPQDVAAAMGVSAGTVNKWRRRYRVEGLAGLRDRPSKPNVSPGKTPDDVETKVIALRRERCIYHRIAGDRMGLCSSLRELRPKSPGTSALATP
jgi:transposase-like protein